MATKTKQAKKSTKSTKAAKPKSAPKAKQNGSKPKAKSNGNGNGGVRNPRWEKLAKLATSLVTRGSDGKQLNRAPISTPKVELVAVKLVGRKQPKAVISALGFKSAKQASDYASAHIGRTDLPEGTSAKLSEAALKLGNPQVHKINGRALAAVLVALAK